MSDTLWMQFPMKTLEKLYRNASYKLGYSPCLPTARLATAQSFDGAADEDLREVLEVMAIAAFLGFWCLGTWCCTHL